MFQFELRKQPGARGGVDLERGFWREVLQAAADYYSQAAAAKSLPGEVVFQALPGTRIERDRRRKACAPTPTARPA